MSYDDLLEKALADLADGCKTPGDVAWKLIKAGCRGVRESECDCPVAIWVGRRIPVEPGDKLRVGYDIAEILTGNHADGLVSVGTAVVPEVIAQFITAFDWQERYPMLAGAEPTLPDGEHFEVYPVSGPASFSTRQHGRLRHDEAITRAQEASRQGPDHCVERVTVHGGQPRRNRIAEYRDGQPVPLPNPASSTWRRDPI